MPVYEFECRGHGPFELMRPMSQAGEAGACPVCAEPGTRVITAPILFTMIPLRRAAAFRNERSRHEPRVCKSGCGHRHDTGGATARLQAYSGPRPWVVEHR